MEDAEEPKVFALGKPTPSHDRSPRLSIIVSTSEREAKAMMVMTDFSSMTDRANGTHALVQLSRRGRPPLGVAGVVRRLHSTTTLVPLDLNVKLKTQLCNG